MFRMLDQTDHGDAFNKTQPFYN